MPPLSKSKLSQSIVKMIVDDIRKGIFAPGTKMPPEHEIMKMFGVGRSSVREAFQSLAIMGVLDIGAGQGTFVRNIAKEETISPFILAPLVDREAAAEYLEARLLVEPSIAALAAQRHTKDEYARMAEVLDQCEEFIKEGKQVNSLGGDFHFLIAKSSHNLVFVRFMGAIIGMLVSRGEKIIRDKKFLTWELKSHREVLESIGSKNPERARSAMDEHIRLVSRYHMKYE